jgi:hypothetical protein
MVSAQNAVMRLEAIPTCPALSDHYRKMLFIYSPSYDIPFYGITAV